eukprot:SAG31_NODE_6884_length_1861_cov_1.061862_3_plen_77_part_01
MQYAEFVNRSQAGELLYLRLALIDLVRDLNISAETLVPSISGFRDSCCDSRVGVWFQTEQRKTTYIHSKGSGIWISS